MRDSYLEMERQVSNHINIIRDGTTTEPILITMERAHILDNKCQLKHTTATLDMFYSIRTSLSVGHKCVAMSMETFDVSPLGDKEYAVLYLNVKKSSTSAYHLSNGNKGMSTLCHQHENRVQGLIRERQGEVHEPRFTSSNYIKENYK